MTAIRPCRPRRAAVRGVAAFCALMLVVSNALAAMGLCIVKAPPAAQDAQAVARVLIAAADTDAGDGRGCPEHAQAAAEPLPQPSPAGMAAHCTQDDPGAQVRANDVPPAALDAVPVFQRIALVALPRAAGAVPAPDVTPPAALYARLSRLLL